MAAWPHPGSISVVVPSFNDVEHIGDALTSIINQTEPPAEIVVSDDGSDDGTEQFMRELVARNERAVEIRYVRLELRSGVVAARNHGITAARGEWIATCDSDDTWAPTKLACQIAFLRAWKGRRRIALLGTHGYNMNDGRTVVSVAAMGPTTEEQYDTIREEGRMFYAIHSSVLFSRADWSAVGGYTTEYGWADDYDFFCRMAELGVVINLPEPLVYYRKRAGSVQLARFWDQRQGLMRLGENQRRRAAGQAPLGPEEFAVQLASASAWRRFGRRRRALGMYYYRSGGTDMVNARRVRGALKLLIASILDGARLRSGVRGVLATRLSRKSPARQAQPADVEAGSTDSP